MAAAIEGFEEMKRRLERIGTSTARRAMRSAVNAGLTPIAKALRAAINATSATPELKREARKTVGKRVKKDRSRQLAAKAGFAVGKKREPPKDRGGKKGIGVGTANVHWFVLGTEQRTIKAGSARGPRAGHPTGQITPPFATAMRAAIAASQGAALEAARNKLSQILLKEASRKG